MNRLSDNEINSLEKQLKCKGIILFKDLINSIQYKGHKVYSFPFKNKKRRIVSNFYFHKNFTKKINQNENELATWEYSHNFTYYYDIIILSNSPILLIQYFLNHKHLLSNKIVLLYCPILLNENSLNFIVTNYQLKELFTIFTPQYAALFKEKVDNCIKRKINIKHQNL